MLSSISTLSRICELTVRSPTRDNSSYGIGSVIIASDNKLSSDFTVNVSARSPKRQADGKAFYIPIPADLSVLPPAPSEGLIDWWSNLILSLGSPLVKELEQISRTNKAKKCYVIIGLQIGVQLAQVAIEFVNSFKAKLPLCSRFIAGWDANAMNVDDMSAQNLLSRGGAESELSSKRVCVIGCGSVGGYIAQSLASSGLGNLTLVDIDKYRPENIHRHVLPASYLYNFKTAA